MTSVSASDTEFLCQVTLSLCEEFIEFKILQKYLGTCCCNSTKNTAEVVIANKIIIKKKTKQPTLKPNF